MTSTDLPPSKLGTKQHWDGVYSLELSNFQEFGDEGEVWFGEDSVEKMVDWVQEIVSVDPAPSILEVGAGNGALLFALQEAGYPARSICGVDYSSDAIQLARAIGSAKGENANLITFEACDFLNEYPRALSGMSTPTATMPQWDLVLDKGTFDAIALADRDADGNAPADGYPPRIAEVVKPGGYFLIVCKHISDQVILLSHRYSFQACNFTEDELKENFATPTSSLRYHSRIAFPSFSFGGQSGNVYSGVAFRKAES
ncbi:hypothetical protein EIP86_007790 [Pleurotus ostreatoroseus]|nr:hypothetical protein EIP86_007790 [Pleurotus ostreatoroseus]